MKEAHLFTSFFFLTSTFLIPIVRPSIWINRLINKMMLTKKSQNGKYSRSQCHSPRYWAFSCRQSLHFESYCRLVKDHSILKGFRFPVARCKLLIQMEEKVSICTIYCKNIPISHHSKYLVFWYSIQKERNND
jgi:hypothetical protein